jgi:hypothetical protein
MTEARIGLSIVTTMKAVGYPECEDLTAHPLARFSKRCDGGAAYVGQTSDSESCAQPVVGRCALRLKPRSQIHPLPLPGQPSPVVLHTEASPQAPERGQTFELEITPVLQRRSFQLRMIGGYTVVLERRRRTRPYESRPRTRNAVPTLSCGQPAQNHPKLRRCPAREWKNRVPSTRTLVGDGWPVFPTCHMSTAEGISANVPVAVARRS